MLQHVKVIHGMIHLYKAEFILILNPAASYSMSFDGNNDHINSSLYNNFNIELSVGLWFKSNQLGQGEIDVHRFMGELEY